MKMSFKLVDQLSGYQMEPGDFILIPGESEPVQIKSIDILESGYQINYLDEYGDEELSFHIEDEILLDFYIFDDED